MGYRDPDKQREYQRQYRANNPEKFRGYLRTYFKKHQERLKDYKRGYYEKNRERLLSIARLRNLGVELGPEEAQAMLLAQGGLCPICGSDKPGGRGDWHADHDHKTGQFRGLLCSTCNVGLGHFRDDPALLRRAIEYLTQKPLDEGIDIPLSS